MEQPKKQQKKKELIEDVNIAELVKKLSKNKTSADRSKEGMKSNVEIGKELDLYIVNDVVGTGLPLLAPNGATIKRILERFIVDEELKKGYQYTSTPIMAKSDLYKISGHWQHYKESMFSLEVGGETFALRPMTCPFQFVIYKSKQRSYKELPIKYAEISTLFRNEKSGELMGLTRLRQFTLADAHIICKPDQLEEEFKKVMDLVKYVMQTLKIEDLTYRFSKWDPKNKEKYVDNPKAWDETQSSMKKILDNLKIEYVEADDEAAFYGPKLDLQYKNIFGKEDTLITIQIDFALPEKFQLTYKDENGEDKSAMVIHRSSIGCFERTIAYLLEKSQGNLPTWLSPIQARVISFTDRNKEAAQKIVDEMKEAGIRVDADLDSNTVNDKVRKAAELKIPYLITIGDKEEEKGTLAVKKRGEDKPKFGVDKEKFISELLEEIKERK
jgi:threonyl-tRNA synthetase